MKSLCKFNYGYRNGISTYRFNTLLSLDSRTNMLVFVTPFFQPDFYAMDVLFQNMPDGERISRPPKYKNEQLCEMKCQSQVEFCRNQT